MMAQARIINPNTNEADIEIKKKSLYYKSIPGGLNKLRYFINEYISNLQERDIILIITEFKLISSFLNNSKLIDKESRSIGENGKLIIDQNLTEGEYPDICTDILVKIDNKQFKDGIILPIESIKDNSYEYTYIDNLKNNTKNVSIFLELLGIVEVQFIDTLDKKKLHRKLTDNGIIILNNLINRIDQEASNHITSEDSIYWSTIFKKYFHDNVYVKNAIGLICLAIALLMILFVINIFAKSGYLHFFEDIWGLIFKK